MEKTIAEVANALKEVNVQEASCLQRICDVLQNHEERLRYLEKPDITCELTDIRRFIENIEGPEKRKKAMAEFVTLCHVLGIEDFEE